MKKGLAIMMIGLYGLAVFQPILYLTTFYLNRSYITAHYCVNRDDPSMHCDGKCFLRKELKDYYVANSRNPGRAAGKENVHIISFWIALRGFSLSGCLPDPFSFVWDHKVDDYAFLFFSSVFHPPASQIREPLKAPLDLV